MFTAIGLQLPQGAEWIIILIVALLIFGKRLPDVGRSIDKGIVEFKKGLKGVQDEVDDVKKDVGNVQQDVKDAGRQPLISDKSESAKPLDSTNSKQHTSA